MAKEWYLLTSPHDQLSGFESDALNEFGEEGFFEALDSELAVNVEVCNYDLSECTQQKVIIQNNHQDTKLKTLSRMMLAPIGTCKAGMYVKYKDRYWLIVGLVDDNKVFEKAILLICNYKISWINDDGRVISRWVNAESASQYNNGESNQIYYFVRSDQLMVYLPDDPEVLLLDNGKRFIVDKRCNLYEQYFDETVLVNTSNPLIVYDITRNDTVLDNYIDSGIIGLMFTQGEQHPNDGYYVVDGVGYWLCDMPNQTAEPADNAMCIIRSDSDTLYIDLEPIVFMADFVNGQGESENVVDYHFRIECDFESDLNTEVIDNSIIVSTSNYNLNNKMFNLILEADGFETATKTITIKEFL